MQIRKLVKSGHASLVMAVPSDWVKKNRLKAGDLLYIKEEFNKLHISTESKIQPKPKKEKVIQVDGKDELALQFEITSAYLNNYHLIYLKGKEIYTKSKMIKKIIGSHVALELIDESSDRIVARDFLNLHDIDLKLLFRRMDNIIRSMITDSKATIEKKDLVDFINDRDDEVNRLSFLIYKILKAAYLDKSIMNSLNITEIDILRYWELNLCIEKIGDRTKNIAELVPDLPKNKQKGFFDLFNRLEKLYLDVMKSFYNLSMPLADSAAKKRNQIMKAIRNYIKDNNCSVCSQIAVNEFNMAGHINDIARIVRYLN